VFFDYHNDIFAHVCLIEAAKSKAAVCFGAILIREREIIGKGWNRHATDEDRRFLTHVDYAIHAEQACVVNAIKKGIGEKELEKWPLQIYVIGVVGKGLHKGTLTVRKKKEFICRKCPPSVLLRFNIPVCIPHVRGWMKLSPEEAARTGKLTSDKGRWQQFLKTGSVELVNR